MNEPRHNSQLDKLRHFFDAHPLDEFIVKEIKQTLFPKLPYRKVSSLMKLLRNEGHIYKTTTRRYAPGETNMLKYEKTNRKKLKYNILDI